MTKNEIWVGKMCQNLFKTRQGLQETAYGKHNGE
jgi:hypothetical protein